MAKKDFYDVLGVGRNAAADQIRAAYRKLARKFHPDVNKAPDASAKFKEATEAYEVLGDPQKRKMYDQFGHAGPGMPFGEGYPGGQGAPGGARSYQWSGSPGGRGINFEDLFGGGRGFGGMSLDEILGALGGGGARGRRSRQQAEPEGRDLEHEVTLDFFQAIRGTKLPLRIQREGNAEDIEVKIPPGVHEGSRIRIRGKGVDGGDLFIITHVHEHPYFRRDGDDIHVELPVSATEAALGAKVDVPTLDGMTTVTVPPGSSSQRKLRLRGRGIATLGGKDKGDQYVVLKIVVPPSVSLKGAELLRQFDAAEKFNPRAQVPWK